MDRPPYERVAPGDTLGLKHLREALRDIEFPRKTSELRDEIGSWRIPTDGARFEPLARYLDGVPEKTFRSAEDVAMSVSRAHPELRD